MSEQTNIQIPDELRKQIDEVFWPLLKRSRGADRTNKSLAYETLLARGLKYTDLTTGHEQPPAPNVVVSTPPALVARLGHTRVRVNRIVKETHTFGERVDLNQLTDAALKKEMNASGMMLWASGPDGANIHVTPWLEKFTGYPAAQFTENGWTELIHPEDQEKTVERFRETFRKRTPVRVWYRLWRADGVYCWIIDYAQPRFANGDFRGYVGTMYQVDLLLFQWSSVATKL